MPPATPVLLWSPDRFTGPRSRFAIVRSPPHPPTLPSVTVTHLETGCGRRRRGLM
eukprot:COSAG01_NODE_51395_length_355_cov_0.722656_1_plen_54_part_10